MPLFKLNSNDFLKGAISAVIAGFVWGLLKLVGADGFDVFSADWPAILNSAVNAAVAAFVGYIGKNFLSDENGKVAGRF